MLFPHKSFSLCAIYKRCKAINVGNFILGSKSSKFTTSSHVMVERSVDSIPKSQLAEIHYFAKCVLHLPDCNTETVWVAAISFFMEHPCHVWFGFPAEVWSTVTETDIHFIPVSSIKSRVFYTENSFNFGRILGDQKVLVVVPIASH